jgi:hypothetical protein
VNWYSGDPSTYAYRNASDADQAHIPDVALWMSNLPSMSYLGCGILGVVLDDAGLIASSKIYFEDWIKYGVHSTGVQGDYTRNGDYGIEQQGRVYSSTNTTMAVLLAEALRRKKSDTSLYTYSTTAGYAGWDGGPKTLKLVIQTELDLRTRALSYYSASPTAGAHTANTHLGKAVGSNGQYSYHDIGYMPARAGYTALGDTTFADKIYSVIRRDTGTYASLEAFPSSPDTGVGQGSGYGWNDTQQSMPCCWMIFGE